MFFVFSMKEMKMQLTRNEIGAKLRRCDDGKLGDDTWRDYYGATLFMEVHEEMLLEVDEVQWPIGASHEGSRNKQSGICGWDLFIKNTSHLSSPWILTSVNNFHFFLFQIDFKKTEIGLCRRFIPGDDADDQKANDALNGRPFQVQIHIASSIYEGQGTCPKLPSSYDYSSFSGWIRCRSTNPIDDAQFQYQRPSIKYRMKFG